MTAPRWQQAIQDALTEHSDAVVVQLASLDPTSPVPHVRSHIARGFLAPARAPALPLLLTTTDVRTPKTAQLIAHPHVQVAWWLAAAQAQFRLAGTAAVVPAPADALHRNFTHRVRGGAGAGGALAALAAEGFDWEAKRVEVFRAMSAHMRASWCRPVPGSRLEGGHEEARKWPETVAGDGSGGGDGAEEEKRNWDTALRNFALVVVEPTEVDYVELGVLPNRRTKFWRTAQGTWEEEAVVP